MKDILLIALLVLIMSASLYDLLVDSGHGATRLHLAVEAGVFLLALGLIAWLLRDLYRQRRALAQLREEVAMQADVRLSGDQAETRHRLGTFIQQQFAKWGLTDSEQAVGLLLLKGLSFREIAAVRSTREKTVRTQASNIYRKAGVSGRHAFAAWFIEDFL